MRKLFIAMISLSLFVTVQNGFAKKKKISNPKVRYGSILCKQPGYTCIKIKRGDTWKKLFRKREQRDIVMRVNRTNMRLRPGRLLAVPKNLKNMSIWDVSPFPRFIKPKGRTVIVVSQKKLAWGAYDTEGELQWWGPISSGKNYCPDVKRNCYTVIGSFHMFNKEDVKCESSKFPVGRGGARMPFCMFFYRGFAMHGSDEVPGYRDSHGCIRLFTKDAKWLNHKFIQLPTAKNKFKGTKVIIQEL